MVLVLVIHTLHTITATVPLCVITIKDYQKRKAIPEQFRVRQIIPTSGTSSVTLWDVTDKELFQNWMNQSLGNDATHQIFDVVEDFAYGLQTLLVQERTTDKLAKIPSNTKVVMNKAGRQFSEVDKKLGISENTSKTFHYVTNAATKAKEKAMENQTVANVATNVNSSIKAGLQSVNKGFDWARTKLNRSLVNQNETIPMDTVVAVAAAANSNAKSNTVSKTVIKENNQLQTNYLNKEINNNSIINNNNNNETELKTRSVNVNNIENEDKSNLKEQERDIDYSNTGLKAHPVNTSPNSGEQSSVAVFSLDDYDVDDDDGLRDNN